MTPLRRPARFLVAVAAAACLILPPGEAARAQAPVGATVVSRMWDAWHSRFFRTMTFVQETTFPDRPTQTWYESMRVPSTLRIDIAPLDSGRAILFLGDSSHTFRRGARVGSRAGANEMLVVFADVYAQPVERSLAALKAAGVDLTRVHQTTWQGEPVQVVGALPQDSLSTQFWVRTRDWRTVRIIVAGQGGAPLDARVERFETVDGVPIETEIVMYRNGTWFQRERYSQVRLNVPLDDAIFDPSRFVRPSWIGGAAAAPTATPNATTTAAQPAAQPAAQATLTAHYPSILTYRTVQVARGVYAFIAPEERTGLQGGNSIAVIGDSAVLIFDTGAMPSVTRRQIAELRTLTDKPVRWVVTSHWHPDHNLGNDEYRKAFPGVRFVGTKATQQGITDRAAHFIEEVRGFQRTDSLMRVRLATGKMRDGSDMPPRVRTMFELNTRDFGEFWPEVSKAVPLTSDQVFTDSLSIQLGKRVVKLYSRGRGNTAGDAFAFIPDVRVLLTGDLVTFPCPFPSTAYFNDWVPLLDHLKSLRAARWVPGHGEVQSNYAFLDQTRALLQYTREKAADAVRRGLTLEAFTKEVSFAQFVPVFAGTDIVRNDAFESFYVSTAVPRAYLEASLAVKGELPPQYPPR